MNQHNQTIRHNGHRHVQQYLHNRQTLRLFLILILAMGLFGGCYAYINWQIEPETLQLSTFTEEGDWIDLVSLLGEQVLQWFFEVYE